MKLLPARFVLERALDHRPGERAALDPETTVIESSSGTMAWALAFVCREMGVRLTLVSGADSMDPDLHQRLAGLGAKVSVVSEEPGVGIQAVRMRRLQEIARQHAKVFWTEQYHNLNNSYAYAPFAAQLFTDLSSVSCIVGPVGSGASMCGTVGFLRRLLPDVYAIGVDTQGSISFGQPDLPRKLGGLGNSIRPANLRHELFDEVHWVSAAEAFLATNELYTQTGLRRGPTSGAAWMVARWWASRNTGTVVMIMPDDGSRYVATVFNDEWRFAEAPLLSLRTEPHEMGQDLVVAEASWTRFEWKRRTLREVTGAPPDPPIGEPRLETAD